jgi:hypothetical protein
MNKVVYEASETGHYLELFPKKNMILGTHNLNEGEEVVAIIERIEKDQPIKGTNGREDKINVLHFDPKHKLAPMALNIGNSRIIAALYGVKYEGWYGKAIQIYSGTVKAVGGGTTQGLCVQPRRPDIGEPVDEHIKSLEACITMEQLVTVFKNIPTYLKAVGSSTAEKLNVIKDEMKEKVNA